MDVTTVTAGLLHDVLEDTATTKADLVREFGADIAELVDGVTKIGKLAFSSREERQAENFRKMVVAMARDIRVLMIKLADRLHNMRTLGYLPTEKAKKIAQETLDIYAPLAHRLGMAKVKAELEDLALRVMHPDSYQELMRRVAKRRLEREAEINQVIAFLQDKLGEVGIEARISGRPKHFYSIWKKMHEGGREFDEIYDLTAVRVITKSVRDCYGALGVIHSLWKPVPGRFKDFIAMPKVNMYQSLHTTVIGPKGDPVEIQIRTLEMHRIAEEGIAAHWLYKERKSDRDKFDDAFTWLRQLMESQKEVKDPKEFLDTVRVDLFPDEVYVFTPKGDVKALPEGATPIDFAYTVHTDVGQHCVGAKVNGKLVPLRYTLRQGDIVEVVTSPEPASQPRLAQDRQVQPRPRQDQPVAQGRGAGALPRAGARAVRAGGQEVPPHPGQPPLGRRDAKARRRAGLPHRRRPPRLHRLRQDVRPAGAGQARARRRPRSRSSRGARRRPRARPTGRCGSAGWTTSSCGSASAARRCRATASWASSRAAAASPCTRATASPWPRTCSTRSGWCGGVGRGASRPSGPSGSPSTSGATARGSSPRSPRAISSCQGNITKADITVTEDRKGINHFVVEVEDLKQLQAIMQAIREVKDVFNVERVRGL